MPRKIILDCDPGHDDVIALLLAHGNPDIELLAVTTVVGNQTLDKVTHNALAVARVAGITGVPFAAGCPRPLVRDVAVAGLCALVIRQIYRPDLDLVRWHGRVDDPAGGVLDRAPDAFPPWWPRGLRPGGVRPWRRPVRDELPEPEPASTGPQP